MCIEETIASPGVEINKRLREKDEWFEEPDDLERVSRALASVDREVNPIVALGFWRIG